MNLLLEDLREVQLHRDEQTAKSWQRSPGQSWRNEASIIDTRETKGLFRLMARYRNLGEIIEQIEKLRLLEQLSSRGKANSPIHHP